MCLCSVPSAVLLQNHHGFDCASLPDSPADAVDVHRAPLCTSSDVPSELHDIRVAGSPVVVGQSAVAPCYVAHLARSLTPVSLPDATACCHPKMVCLAFAAASRHVHYAGSSTVLQVRRRPGERPQRQGITQLMGCQRHAQSVNEMRLRRRSISLSASMIRLPMRLCHSVEWWLSLPCWFSCLRQA